MTAPLSPNSRTSTTVASAEAEMLTTLLPSSSAPISRSRMSVSFSTVLARLLPRRSSSLMRAREVAVRAVSEPEKNADINNMPKMAAMEIQISALIVLSCPP